MEDLSPQRLKTRDFKSSEISDIVTNMALCIKEI